MSHCLRYTPTEAGPSHASQTGPKTGPANRLLVVGQVRFQSSQRTTNHHLFPPGSWRKKPRISGFVFGKIQKKCNVNHEDVNV